MSTRIPEQSGTHFSLGQILGRLFGLMIFVLMTTWGAKTIAVDPARGWFATILFASVSAWMIVDIVRICGADEAPRVVVPRKQRLRRALIQAGTIIVAIFLGLADVFIARWLNSSFLALWLAAFVTNLAFYPLRRDEEKDLSSFSLWAVYCALMALGSVVLSFITDWLKGPM